MPVPTDTFWNIKRLNVVFALSALALLAVTAASILQDYDKYWRQPQRSGRIWDAALTEEKIHTRDSSSFEAQKKQLDDAIQKADAALAPYAAKDDTLRANQQQLEEKSGRTEFQLNDLKARVTVDESHLQDAITHQDTAGADQLRASLKGPEADLADLVQELATDKQQIQAIKNQLAEDTKAIDELTSQRTKLTSDLEALGKKEQTLAPDSIVARLSAKLRAMPLMQFMNPAERIQQVVLPDIREDVAFKKIDTVDRCTTCHVNAGDKDYTRANLIAYLEEQESTSRNYALPATAPAATPAGPTASKPGAVAKPEFWHYWARQLLPEAVYAKSAGPLARQIFLAIGKKDFKVVLDAGLPSQKDVPDTYKANNDVTTQPSLAAPEAVAAQDKVFVATVDALLHAAGNTAVAAQRNYVLLYVDRLKTLLKAQLSASDYAALEERYRQALVADVNVAREKAGLDDLDPSPVLLAHPDLSLYVDVDSKHPFESVGCTSCHDGSGQETDFVLTAHTPRPIWVDRQTGEVVLAQQLRPREKPAVAAPTLFNVLEAIYPSTALFPFRLSDLHVTLQPAGAIAAAAAPGGSGGDVLTTPAITPAAEELDLIREPAEDADAVPYIDPVSGKTGFAVAQGKYWADKYESSSGTTFEKVNELWDWPMRPPEQIQANCVRCHTDVYDIKEAAPVVYEGRKLFATLGCVNCHQMDSIPDYETRKVGPDLRHVTSKLSPEFINTWVWSPKAFRPSTKMPHFFMQENNSSDEEIRRTRQEVRAITEYLVETATPLDAKYALPDGITGDYERGKTLFLGINGSGVKPTGGVSNQAGLGCLACHANLNEEAENWIVNDLVLDQGFARPKAEAAFAAMTYDERQMYCVRHFEAPAGTTTVSPTYNDDAHTPKPVFMHHGPELSGVGTKLLASRSREQATQWLFQWLKEPKHYSESTVMPQLRVTDQEALDLAAYLLGQTRQKVDDELKTGKTDSWAAGLTPVDPDKLHELISLQLRSRFSPKDADAAASDPAQITSLATDALTSTLIPADEAAKRVAAMSPEKREMIFLGKKMIGTYGCMSCHAINGTEALTNIGTNLSDWGQKQVSKLDFGYLEPAKIDSMPPTTHITVINGLSPDAANLAHGDLPAGPIGAAVEVGWPHVEETRTSWITQKLHNTRIWDRGRVLLEPTRKTDDKGNLVVASGHPVIADSGKPYDKLRMPLFYLSDEQINALTTFVLSNRDHLVSDHMIDESVTPQSHAIAKGRALVELYNCVSCHQIEGNVAQIQQYFLTNELTTFAPPSLRGEGNKIQPQWLYNFFTSVEPIRTLPTIRMPTFPWQETQTNNQPTAVLDYFGNASLKEAAELNVDLAAVQKYVDSKQPPATPGAATRPAVAIPNAPRPGDDWWQQPSLLAARQHLLDWALAHKQITEIDVDFSKAFNVTPAALNKTYNSILFKARFTANLYACPFPFVDTPKTNDPPDRFKTGEQFFAQMTCLTCHVLGDPAAPGAVAVPKGPNLSLAYRRLQARWIRAWIQEPPIIQVGTNMPQAFSGFFPSTGVYLLHGQTYPEALNMAPEVIADEKAKYGKTADEQTSLLMDFLFAAGPTGHSTILSATRPAAPAQPPPP